MAATMQGAVPVSDFKPSPLELSLDEQDQMRWAAVNGYAFDTAAHTGDTFDTRSPFLTTVGGFYHHVDNVVPYNDNFGLVYPSQFTDPTYPRSYSNNNVDLSGIHNTSKMMEASYPPTAYQLEPFHQHDAMDLTDAEIKGQLMQMSNEYEPYQYDGRLKKEEYTAYRSPHSDLTRASTPQSASGGEDSMIDKEQPYAQLIFHALMNAPEKTMVLRDIYEWFKQNTDKANGSETKGWQNSIRHNLSMNGVGIPGTQVAAVLR